MPSPASPRPQPEPPDPPLDTKPREFRHVRPIDDAADGVTRHGHGSGCIPIFLIRFSILAVIVYLACVAAAWFLAHRTVTSTPPKPAASSAGVSAGSARPRT